MSTLKLVNLQHPSNPNAAISLDAAGISSDIELTTLPFFGGTPTINVDVTVSNTYNFMTPGPITVANNRTVTVANGATWTVL
jgi:hypothetical protein